MTTWRPEGPIVHLTASARRSTPFFISRRAASSNMICLVAIENAPSLKGFAPLGVLTVCVIQFCKLCASFFFNPADRPRREFVFPVAHAATPVVAGGVFFLHERRAC